MSYREHHLTPEQNARIEEFQKTLPEQPVDIVGLIRAFDCDYQTQPLPLGVAGAIFHDDGNYQIVVNNCDPETRQRFTAAHELAHYLLHRDHLSARHTDNLMLRSGLSNRFEMQANRLAAELLMPQDVLDALTQAEAAPQNTASLARVFGVSRQALLVRLGIPEHPALVQRRAGLEN